MDKEEVVPAYYTVKEFAIKIQVHPNTIRRAIRNGRISAFKVGLGKKSSYRIPYSETERIALFDLDKLIKEIINKHYQ